MKAAFRLSFCSLTGHYFKLTPNRCLQAFPFLAFFPSAWSSSFQTLWLSSQFVPSLWSRARCCLQQPPPFRTFHFPFFYPHSFLMYPTLFQSCASCFSISSPLKRPSTSVLPWSSSLHLHFFFYNASICPPILRTILLLKSARNIEHTLNSKTGNGISPEPL